jgi:pimeloyl-ACP methyl ester carboxylesterase
VTHTEITVLSHGVTCAAWHVKATSDDRATEAGRPCVVMAHGFGGTRDSGLVEYAEQFARAGYDSFVFDYRGWGSSEGTPRQDVAYKRQRQDYRAALEAARRLRGVDPDRIVLWGTSYSSGHAIAMAAQGADAAAIICMNPAVDGFAALGQIAKYAGVGQLAWATHHGLVDAVRAATRKPPHRVPIVGPVGSKAIMTTPGAAEAFAAMAGPTAANEVCARTALEAARNRPTIYARSVTCPMLVQIGANDQVAPAPIARKMTRKAGDHATVLEYPIDHFDVYSDPWRTRLCTDQIEFLNRVLGD